LEFPGLHIVFPCTYLRELVGFFKTNLFSLKSILKLIKLLLFGAQLLLQFFEFEFLFVLELPEVIRFPSLPVSSDYHVPSLHQRAVFEQIYWLFSIDEVYSFIE